MATQTQPMKQHDLLPQLQVTLEKTDPVSGVTSAVDLTTATSVLFLMRNAIVGLKVNALATITAAATGAVAYTWTGTDTDTAGLYDGEFQVTWGSGKIETFPNDSYLKIKIYADLGP